MFSKTVACHMRTQMPKTQFFQDNSWSILPHAGPAALSSYNPFLHQQVPCISRQLHRFRMCSFPNAFSENSTSTSKAHFFAFPCHSTLCLLSNYRTQFSSDQIKLHQYVPVCSSVWKNLLSTLWELIIIYTIFVFLLVSRMICVVRGTGNIFSHTSKAEMQFNKS